MTQQHIDHWAKLMTGYRADQSFIDVGVVVMTANMNRSSIPDEVMDKYTLLGFRFAKQVRLGKNKLTMYKNKVERKRKKQLRSIRT